MIIKGKIETIREVYTQFAIIGKSKFYRDSNNCWRLKSNNKLARVELFEEIYERPRQAR